jgi:site-specific DNA-methyltransferase (adenine-specific)
MARAPELDTIVCGDCLDVMRDMPDGCVDAIITDPPYGISYQSAWRTDTNGNARKSSPSFGVDKFDPRWLDGAYRIARDDACLYFFTRWDVMGDWKKVAEAAGWHVVQRLIWDKCHWAMGDLRYYGAQTEDVLFCRKGMPVLQWEKRRGDMYRLPSRVCLPEGKYDHPTQKPEVLMAQFIRDASRDAALIFDPFLGSGTTAVAALKTGRHFHGCDISQAYIDIANQRIAKARLEMAQQEMILGELTNG